MEGSSQSQQMKRRQWTILEDELLVAGLLQLIDDGWKVDASSFKPGYFRN